MNEKPQGNKLEAPWPAQWGWQGFETGRSIQDTCETVPGRPGVFQKDISGTEGLPQVKKQRACTRGHRSRQAPLNCIWTFPGMEGAQ